MTIAEIERAAMWWECVTDAVDAAERVEGGPVDLAAIRGWLSTGHGAPAARRPRQTPEETRAVLGELVEAGLVAYVPNWPWPRWRLA